MDHSTPASMSGAARKCDVHWTTFPARSLTGVRWDDHGDAHRAVMRLFPRELEGSSGERRAANGILYRLDVPDAETTVLVQSQVPPELMPSEARTLRLTEAGWRIGSGDRFRFRVSVHAVRRNGRRDTERVVPPEEAPDWLVSRLGGAVEELELFNHLRSRTTSGAQASSPRRIDVDTFDGVATAGDAEELDTLRRRGVGRFKAYGCGLLTAQRITAG